MKLGILLSHPIQYYAPIFRELSSLCDLTVFFAHQQTPSGQSAAGFNVEFKWDVELFGYEHKYLTNIARTPSTDEFAGCDTPGIFSELQSEKFDAFVVMGWYLKSYWQAVWACRRLGVPVFVRGDSQLGMQNSVLKSVIKRIAYPMLLSAFDGVFFVGKRNYEYMRHYFVPQNKLFFAPHCVDNAHFKRRDENPDPSTDLSLLFVGKLIQRKRPADLIFAARLLIDQGVKVVVQYAGEGEFRNELKILAEQNSVPCEFLGFCNQSELPPVYSSADFLILPSTREETWGLVVNEALAAGTPCIVSDSCGCSEDLVIEGKTGQVFPEGQIDALAQAVLACRGIVKNNGTMKQLMEKYSPENCAKCIVEGAIRQIEVRRP